MKDSRADSFVPLTAAPMPDGRRPDVRVTVLKPEVTPQAFQPLVTSEPRPAAPHLTPRPASAVCEPRVTVERDGNMVSAIRIQCTCGQTIELACVYEAGSAKV